MTMTDPTPRGPYEAAARIYWDAGWRGILPLPPRKKASPPTGKTGTDAPMQSYPDVDAWATGPEGVGNIALRLPPDVIGVDVDHYAEKQGGWHLYRLEQELGPLPRTWRTTSRDDGISGIRLFRVPPGLRWPGIMAAGIETIRHGHRYAVVWPSVHPEGKVYRWLSNGDPISMNRVPIPAELPNLPDRWIDEFTHGELAVDQPRAGLTRVGVTAFFAARSGGRPCDHMRGAMTDAEHAIASAAKEGGARHDATMKAVNRIVWLIGEGHPGGMDALNHTHAAFTRAVADPAREPEWDRMVDGAVDKTVAVFPETPDTDPCRDLLPKGSPPWEPNKIANRSGGSLERSTGSTPTSHSSPPSSNGSPTPPSTTFDLNAAAGHAAVVGSSSDPNTAATATASPASDAGNAAAPDASPSASRYVPGSAFLADVDDIPTIWGRGDEVLWARGEPVMIVGQPGVGKTTLAASVVHALLVGGTVLGYPVEPTPDTILYLAMDRPRQIRRNLFRTLGDLDAATLDRIIFWPGPPPADLATWPEVMYGMAMEVNAKTIIVDSLKDAAIGLGKDEVAAGYQRARSFCMANGVEILELHHMTKRNGEAGKAPTDLAGIYGSQWITSGAGSVIFLHGVAGDPIVELKHLKQPSDVVGPLRVIQNIDGTMSLQDVTDPLTLVRESFGRGMTAKAVAMVLEDKPDPGRNAVERARRKLDRLVRDGYLRREEGVRGGVDGGTAATYFWLTDEPLIGPKTDHAGDHAPEMSEGITGSESDHVPADPRTESDHATDHADHGDRYMRDPPSERGGGVTPMGGGGMIPNAGLWVVDVDDEGHNIYRHRVTGATMPRD